MDMLMQLLPLLILIVIMYFLLIKPQKKKEKAIKEMRDAIKVGDEIVTIGGIFGKVVKTKEESLVIAVGADKVKFEVTRWAVSAVINPAEVKKTSKPAAEKEEAEAEAPAKKPMPKKLVKKEAAPAEETPAVEEAPAAEAPNEEN